MGLNGGFKKIKAIGEYKKIKIRTKPPWGPRDFIAIENNIELIAKDASPKRAREKAIARGVITPRIVLAEVLNSSPDSEYLEHPLFDI